MHVCAFSQNHKIFKNKAILLTALHKFIKHIPESIWIYISAMKKMHEIFQFCCNKSQFHFENCHSPFNDFSRNYGCHIGFKLWVTSIFLCFDVMLEQQAKISGRGSEAGPMKSFHDVMYVFSCFSNPPFFSHVKLASNQFDVDNFAFISVLNRSHLELELNFPILNDF